MVKAKLTEAGISASILQSVERELRHEGLSLGDLATPVAGSLAALAPEAIAGRWLARKLERRRTGG